MKRGFSLSIVVAMRAGWGWKKRHIALGILSVRWYYEDIEWRNRELLAAFAQHLQHQGVRVKEWTEEHLRREYQKYIQSL